MATILNIETSTTVCSVALAVDGKVVAIKESHTKNSHAVQITLFCEAVLKEYGIGFPDLDAVAVSKGPGSYTGLRIGVSTAKGFCYAIDKPLIAIGTLKAMAAGMIENESKPEDFLYCPMIDARRMEVYSAFFDSELNELKKTEAVVVDENSFSDLLSSHKIIFAGDGAAKCREILSHQQHAIFKGGFHPSTAFMAQLSEQKFNQQDFENVAYFEPFYLKDFVAGIPRVKGLR
ncbi:MAG: tRNA (adenosine(37)-N6)-threonylcarbamoyltransferase complex dimerization subunit type 1 TsaB [Bacteroidales bacterium]|nr:tRNA (adenosine(37)-N6)-threonylcarbamoyltransferase complex dimerization subunit type 1 TsaB [Bacteroidales bacterium]MCF6342064.1 tRNA (adenosine(37)-N6)-threonylcarbamoyltransferase complex dimerization subunit type 1 TsaB [Bacteroidales bacterium]